MSGIGYIVREEYMRLAMEKALPNEAERLAGFLEAIAGLDRLERSFVERLRVARGEADVQMPSLSRSATEMVSQSFDADREYHRLLSRRCRRATSAAAVLEELVTAAEDDLEEAELQQSGPMDAPARQLSEELVQEKRRMLQRLTSLLRSVS